MLQGIGYGVVEVGRLICLCMRLGFVGNERVHINIKKRDLMLSEVFYKVLFSIMYTRIGSVASRPDP